MTGKVSAVAITLSLTLAALGFAQLHAVVLAAADAQMQMQIPGPTDQGIPSYHAHAPMPPIPATLDPKQFRDTVSRNVYTLAAKTRPVLYQQPCYCYCDRNNGHKSLLDCYSSTHGSECDTCQKEAVFAYQQTQKGKTPSQIRAAMIRGDWKSVDMRPYLTDLSIH